MPYIKPEDRPALDTLINQFPGGMSAGELAYVVYRLMLRATRGGNYATLSTFIGTVLCTVREFQERVLDPYERTKAVENGDVTE